MKAIRAAIFALGICMVMGTAFASGANAAQSVKPVVLHANKTAIVGMGEQFTIALEENASTGYSWSYTANEALKLVSEITQPPKYPDRDGAPYMKTWVFRAEKTGIYALKFSYARSWEEGVPPAETVEFRVIVEEKNDADFLDPLIRNNVQKGGLFRVALQANPSTGYSWKIIKNKAIQLVGEKTIEGTESMLLGAPVQKIWTFKALKKGSTTLKFGYANPAGVIEKTVSFRLKIK